MKLLTLAGTLGCWKWLAWQHWGSSYFPDSSCQCILGHTWAWVSRQLPESLPIQRLLVLYHYPLVHSLSESNKVKKKNLFNFCSNYAAAIIIINFVICTLEKRSQTNGQREENPAWRGEVRSRRQLEALNSLPQTSGWVFLVVTSGPAGSFTSLRALTSSLSMKTLHFFRFHIPLVMTRNSSCCRKTASKKTTRKAAVPRTLTFFQRGKAKICDAEVSSLYKKGSFQLVGTCPHWSLQRHLLLALLITKNLSGWAEEWRQNLSNSWDYVFKLAE